jgi:tetratricopeptide (TPR) repeat protein
MKNPSAESIYWLTGAAGTGKTTVAQSVAAMAKDHGCLGGSFFFSRTDESTQRRRAVSVIPSISYQLARKLNMFRTALCQAVTSEPDICTSGLAKQAEVLLSRTFRVVSNASDLPLVVVIDALDECDKDPRSGREGGDLIPTLIKTFQDAAPLCVKLFVTSRPERTIENMFSHRLISGFTTALSLHLDIEQEIVRDDIVLYLRHELDRLADERSIPPPFPSEAEFKTLVDRAGVLFIYVRTVVMYVSSAVREPSEQVADLIRSDLSNITEKFAFLDGLYIQILIKALDNFGRSTTAPRQFRDVLTCLVLLQRSPSIQSLARLTGIEEQLCKTILLCLSSVLLYEHKAQEPVRLMHPSFSDFLRDANRCSVPDLVVNAEAHETLLGSCSNLAVVSWTRFRETRDINILDEVIIFSREVLALCPPGHPGHGKSCEDIANALQTRYDEMDDVVALDEAIELYRNVLDLRPTGHPNRATSCAYLAGSLTARYQQAGGLDLLDEIIGLEREGLNLRPLGHPDRSESCTNLANSLMTRYRQIGDVALLDEVIYLGREALALRPPGYPDRSEAYTNLANSLMMRYQQTGDMALIDEAIGLGREALDLHPLGHPAALLVNMYAKIVDQLALPLAAKSVLDTSSRIQHWIGTDACVAALLAEQPTTAMTLLDRAHGLMWSQALHQRDPQMQGVPKYLARELEDGLRTIDLARVLDHPQDLRHRQNTRIQAILREVRAMPGLAHFMLGITYETLREAAHDHPVVVLVAARDQAFALIIPSSLAAGPDILRLNIAHDILQSFSNPVGRANIRYRGCSPSRQDIPLADSIGSDRATHPEDHSTRRTWSPIARLWLDVVKPVLTHLGLTVRCSWK